MWSRANGVCTHDSENNQAPLREDFSGRGVRNPVQQPCDDGRRLRLIPLAFLAFYQRATVLATCHWETRGRVGLITVRCRCLPQASPGLVGGMDVLVGSLLLHVGVISIWRIARLVRLRGNVSFRDVIWSATATAVGGVLWLLMLAALGVPWLGSLPIENGCLAGGAVVLCRRHVSRCLGLLTLEYDSIVREDLLAFLQLGNYRTARIRPTVACLVRLAGYSGRGYGVMLPT